MVPVNLFHIKNRSEAAGNLQLLLVAFTTAGGGFWLPNTAEASSVGKSKPANFVRVGCSSSKYLVYLQLGAPLLPASIQEYNDPQSQWVGSLGSLHLRG